MITVRCVAVSRQRKQQRLPWWFTMVECWVARSITGFKQKCPNNTIPADSIPKWRYRCVSDCVVEPTDKIALVPSLEAVVCHRVKIQNGTAKSVSGNWPSNLWIWPKIRTSCAIILAHMNVSCASLSIQMREII
jgi:hypothetical protein